jgi:hypothetical protein
LKIWMLILLAISPIILSLIGVITFFIWKIRNLIKEKAIKTLSPETFFAAYFIDEKNNQERKPLSLPPGTTTICNKSKATGQDFLYDIVPEHNYMGLERDKKGKLYPYSIYIVGDRKPINLNTLRKKETQELKDINSYKKLYEDGTIDKLAKAAGQEDVKKIAIIAALVILAVIAMFFLFYHPQSSCVIAQSVPK